MQLGQMIAKIRKEQGMTQETFAKKFDVTRQTVSNWENGMLPVKRTIKNNKFLYRQPCYGWRYFMR